MIKHRNEVSSHRAREAGKDLSRTECGFVVRPSDELATRLDEGFVCLLRARSYSDDNQPGTPLYVIERRVAYRQFSSLLDPAAGYQQRRL